MTSQVYSAGHRTRYRLQRGILAWGDARAANITATVGLVWFGFFKFALALWIGSPALGGDLSATFTREKLGQMDAAILECIKTNGLPGGVLWVERNGAGYHKAYGHRALLPAQESMTEDTLFDAASLTKVIATTPAVMLLVERQKVTLEAPVQTYLPEFSGEGKESITVRELLSHTSGLRAGLVRTQSWSGYKKAIELACAEKPLDPPGKVFRYSDVNFILLGEIVQRAGGRPLAEFVAREIYQPLKIRRRAAWVASPDTRESSPRQQTWRVSAG
jgi:CubicO group peptidase (beta-lactamase class C family)